MTLNEFGLYVALPITTFSTLFLSLTIFDLKKTNNLLRADLGQARSQIEQLRRRFTRPAVQTPMQDGLFQKAVEGLVGLGVPGLILLVAIATSGFAGAAAITTALAALGGPLGMIGGIGVLVLLGIVSKAVAKHGLPRIADAVIRGLVARGSSKQHIQQQVDKYPKWVISEGLRSRVQRVLNEVP